MEYKELEKFALCDAYIRRARPLLNKGALFADGTVNYVIPNEVDPGDIVRFRFRTARGNVDSVALITQDARIPMKVAEHTEDFDYYEVKHRIDNEVLYYYFEIQSGFRKFYYNAFGLGAEIIQEYSFRLAPGFHVTFLLSGKNFEEDLIMKELIAYCGLDCEKCNARIATINNDDTLRDKTARLWAEINHAPITKEMINCYGCRVDGMKTPYCESMCAIRQCALSKGLATCGDCVGLEDCETVGMVLANSAEAMVKTRYRSRRGKNRMNPTVRCSLTKARHIITSKFKALVCQHVTRCSGALFEEKVYLLKRNNCV